MKTPNPLRGALALALALASTALPAADAALANDARAAMNRATTFMRSSAAEGGYLWRDSPDLKERAGENVATPTQIWVQPPGTPSMGMAFLRAFEATGDALYLVIDGKVRVHKQDRVIAELGERECFGEMAILDAAPRSATVTALTETAMLKITREDFQEIMTEKPEIAMGIIKVLTRRLRDAIR